ITEAEEGACEGSRQEVVQAQEEGKEQEEEDWQEEEQEEVTPQGPRCLQFLRRTRAGRGAQSPSAAARSGGLRWAQEEAPPPPGCQDVVHGDEAGAVQCASRTWRLASPSRLKGDPGAQRGRARVPLPHRR